MRFGMCVCVCGSACACEVRHVCVCGVCGGLLAKVILVPVCVILVPICVILVPVCVILVPVCVMCVWGGQVVLKWVSGGEGVCVRGSVAVLNHAVCTYWTLPCHPGPPPPPLQVPAEDPGSHHYGLARQAH